MQDQKIKIAILKNTTYYYSLELNGVKINRTYIHAYTQ